jgi:Fe-S-cluster containining protein
MTIINYLKTTRLIIDNAFEENSSYRFPRETEGDRCVFLDKYTEKCQIHLVKPETCVAGPITFDINLNTGRIEWFLKTENICPLAGALYRDKLELQKHMESARRELLKLVHDLDAKALQAILKIEESETFKIGEENLSLEVLTKLRLLSNSSAEA